MNLVEAVRHCRNTRTSMQSNDTLKTSILARFSTYARKHTHVSGAVAAVVSDDQAAALKLVEETLVVLEKKKFDLKMSPVELARELGSQLSLSQDVIELVAQFFTTEQLSQSNLLLLKYVLALKADNCSASTIKNYRSDINQFFTFSQESSLSKVMAKPKLQAFLREQKAKGLAQSSIRRKLASITQFGIWLELEQLVPTRSLKWLIELNQQSSHTPASNVAAPLVEQPKNTQINKAISANDQSSRLNWSSFVFGKNSTPTSSQDRSSSETAKSISPLKSQERRFRLRQGIYGLRSKLQTQSQQYILPYLNFMLSLILFLGLGYFGYLQVFGDVDQPLAYPTSLTRPNKTLSFQGRLTDSNQNPIISASDMRFRLYDSGPSTSGGNLLWDSNTCAVTPDQDGIFAVGLGSDCGTEIGNEVFSENANVWLQVEVEGEILDPRQSIKSVAYALNSETLQGFPPANPTTGATSNTVLVMNNNGEILLAQNNPKLDASSGTFTIEAQTLTLQTGAGSNGNITLDPDGSGKINLLANVDVSGYIHAPGATLSATYAGGTALTLKAGPGATADIMRWQDSAGNSLGVIDENGNIGIGTTNPIHMLDVTGNARIYGGNLYLGSGTSANPGYIQMYRSTITAPTSGGGNLVIARDDTCAGGADCGVVVRATTANSVLVSRNNFISFTTGSSERMRINSNGNLGIGSTSPTYKLDVAGTGRFTGALELDSTLIDITGSAGTAGQLLSSTGSGTDWIDASMVGTNHWNLASNVLHPIGALAEVADLVIGGTSTASADFRVTGLGNGSTDLSGYTYGRRFIDIDSTGYYVEPGNTSIAGLFAGNVAIGTTTPTGSDGFAENALLSLVSPTVGGTNRERLLYAKVSDSNNYFSVINTTSTAGLFIPTFVGYAADSSSTHQALSFDGRIDTADDTGTTPILSFRAQQLNGTSAVSTRPIAGFGSGTNGNTMQAVIWSGGGMSIGDSYSTSNPGADNLIVEGNIGIGTTNPSAFKLQVNGNIGPQTTDADLGSASLRWDLFANTINADSTVTLTGLGTGTDNTVLVLNSSNNVTTDEIDSRVWGSTLVDGSGTTNYVARWSDANTLTTGVLYDNGTSVGIGTTTPNANLHIYGTSTLIALERTSGSINEWNFGIGQPTGMGLAAHSAYLAAIDAAADFGIRTTTSGGAAAFIVKANGNVGIGNTNPPAKLSISGATAHAIEIDRTGGQESIKASASDGYLIMDSSGQMAALNWYVTDNVILANGGGNVGIDDTNPVFKLDVAGTGRFTDNLIANNAFIGVGGHGAGYAHFSHSSMSGAGQYALLQNSTGTTFLNAASGQTINFRINNTNQMVLNANGNLGIGATSPTALLHVAAASNPNIRIDASSGTSSTGNATLEIRNDANVVGTINVGRSGLSGKGSNLNIESDNEIRFYASDRNALRALINTNGNVGIGTATVSHKLHVHGTVASGTTMYGIATGTGGVGVHGTASAASSIGVYGTNTGGGYAFAGTSNSSSAAAAFDNIGTGTGIKATAQSNYAFHGTRGQAASTVAYFINTTTSCTISPGAGNFACTSDARLKKDVSTISNSLDAVLALRGVKFRWNSDESDSSFKLGFIAQEAEAVVPEIVFMGEDGYRTMDYSVVTPLLVNAMQEQQTQIEALAQATPTNLTFSSAGELALSGSSSSYTVTPVGSSSPLNTIIGASQAVVGKITSGLVTTRELVVSNSAQIANLSVSSLQVSGQNINDYIKNIVQQELQTTPLPADAVADTFTTNSLTVTDDATISGELAATTIQAQDIEAGSLSADSSSLGSLLATTATVSGDLSVENDASVAGTLIAGAVESESSRFQTLEARMAQLEEIKAQTAEIVTATVSGTLYADDIYNFDEKVANAFKKPSLLDLLLNNDNPDEPTAASPASIYEPVELAGYASTNPDLIATDSAILDLDESDVVLGASALFVEKYLEVNGHAYVAQSLGIGNTLKIGNSLVITNGTIDYHPAGVENPTLAIQSSGQGKLDFLAGAMTIENGLVAITGDLTVAGKLTTDTLLTNLVQPADFGTPFQVQVAGASTESGEIKKTRFEIINETGEAVATFDADGNASFAGGISVANQDLVDEDLEDNSVTTEKSSGQAKLAEGKDDIKIKTPKATPDSLIYVTPKGSTDNKVLYIKDQAEGEFTVGFDEAIDSDVEFNWWIVN